jgi:uncharacterized DUF497 family protein
MAEFPYDHTGTRPSSFDWDPVKDAANQRKHGVGFAEAQHAFLDPRRVLARDVDHSQVEPRFYCFGEVDGRVMTVRFAWRGDVIRIIGAGYWRRGRRTYEAKNRLYR